MGNQRTQHPLRQQCRTKKSPRRYHSPHASHRRRPHPPISQSHRRPAANPNRPLFLQSRRTRHHPRPAPHQGRFRRESGHHHSAQRPPRPSAATQTIHGNSAHHLQRNRLQRHRPHHPPQESRQRSARLRHPRSRNEKRRRRKAVRFSRHPHQRQAQRRNRHQRHLRPLER